MLKVCFFHKTILHNFSCDGGAISSFLNRKIFFSFVHSRVSDTKSFHGILFEIHLVLFFFLAKTV